MRSQGDRVLNTGEGLRGVARYGVCALGFGGVDSVARNRKESAGGAVKPLADEESAGTKPSLGHRPL